MSGAALPSELPEVVVARIESGEGELRVSLRHYRGRPFVWVQRWAIGADGVLRPDNARRMSIRLHEVGGLVRALVDVQRRNPEGLP